MIYICINSSPNHISKHLLLGFFYEYDDLATLEVIYSPRMRRSRGGGQRVQPPPLVNYVIRLPKNKPRTTPTPANANNRRTSPPPSLQKKFWICACLASDSMNVVLVRKLNHCIDLKNSNNCIRYVKLSGYYYFNKKVNGRGSCGSGYHMEPQLLIN